MKEAQRQPKREFIFSDELEKTEIFVQLFKSYHSRLVAFGKNYGDYTD